MPGVVWLPVSMSDVNNNAVGPSSLAVRPTVYFVQGPQRLWALESQLGFQARHCEYWGQGQSREFP